MIDLMSIDFAIISQMVMRTKLINILSNALWNKELAINIEQGKLALVKSTLLYEL